MKYNAPNTKLAEENPLFAAIMRRDENEISALKAKGETFSDELKGLLVNGCYSSDPDITDFMMNYYKDQLAMTAEDFVFIMPRLRAETGAPLDALNGLADRLCDASALGCFIECFNTKRVNKKKTMKSFIDKNRADLLTVCAEHGWLGSFAKCGELIEYANSVHSTECAAFLLAFKNNNFDLPAERVKAEKKAERQLCAAPDSVTALKALWCWRRRADGGLGITRYKGGSTEVTVPERIGKNTVTALGMAFSPVAGAITREMSEFRKTITRITLPETITEIANYAFAHCEGLEYVNIPDAVTSIGKGAFFCCASLKSIDLPSGIDKIYPETFQHCRSLTSLIIPEGVKTIDHRAFIGCESLEEVTLPSGLTSISDEAFWDCEHLREITLPPGLKKIPKFCFMNCGGLVRAVIPSGVTEIALGAFEICGSLARINIPDTVVSIGDTAFVGCSALETAVIPEGVKKIGVQAFAGCQNLKRAELPRSLTDIAVVSFDSTGKRRTIFDNCPNVTAVVYPESRAEEYCKQNGIPFTYK